MLPRTSDAGLGGHYQAPIQVVWVTVNEVFSREVSKGQGQSSSYLYPQRFPSISGKIAGQLKNSHCIKHHIFCGNIMVKFDLGSVSNNLLCLVKDFFMNVL